MEHSSGEKAKSTVLAFIDAMNKEDFDKAREYVNEDMNFIKNRNRVRMNAL